MCPVTARGVQWVPCVLPFLPQPAVPKSHSSQGPSVSISGPEALLVAYSSVRCFLLPSLSFPLAPVLSGLVVLTQLFSAPSLPVTSASYVQTLLSKQSYPLTKTPSGTSIDISDSHITAQVASPSNLSIPRVLQCYFPAPFLHPSERMSDLQIQRAIVFIPRIYLSTVLWKGNLVYSYSECAKCLGQDTALINCYKICFHHILTQN